MEIVNIASRSEDSILDKICMLARIFNKEILNYKSDGRKGITKVIKLSKTSQPIKLSFSASLMLVMHFREML